MKPRLKHGRPINKRAPQLPRATYICKCAECLEQWAWDPLANALVQGKTCGRKEYESHQRDEEMKGLRIGASTLVNENFEATEEIIHTPSRKTGRSPPVPASSSADRTLAETETTPPARIRSCNDARFIYQLQDLRHEGAKLRPTFSFDMSQKLVFSNMPCPDSTCAVPTYQSQCYNTGPYALQHDCPANDAVLSYERWLLNACERIDLIEVVSRPAVRDEKDTTLLWVQSEQRIVEKFKMLEWQKRVACQLRARAKFKGNARVVLTTQYLGSLPAGNDPLIFGIYLVVAVLHVLCQLSMEHCEFLLHGIRVILLLFVKLVCTLAILPDITVDVRKIVDRLDLKPESKAYCCCPKCFHCYDIHDYPDYCTGQKYPGAPPCGRGLKRHLYRLGTQRTYATRRYLYHDMKLWLGRMLCRPDLEEYMDRDVYDAPHEHDIWDGEILKDFRGPDNARFVGRKPGHEGRYVFGLNMDGFNPNGNKKGGKIVSCGAIYMVCLNLPPHLRYRPENIFLVSIIPGPHHPALTEINHLLRPLVDDLVEFWTRGVWYSSTFKYPQGRLVRCALVPIICDLPAARQIMGFASYSAKTFCCYCGLDKDDMDNLDVANWPPGIQDRTQYVHLAEQWKGASKQERDKLFERYGVRYSELLRLPYWDPTKFVVIDSMHGLLQTILRNHCRVIWGMDVEATDSDRVRKRKKRSPLPTEDESERAWELMRRGRNSDVQQLPMKIIKQLCIDVQIPIGAHKKKLLDLLYQHRRDRKWVDDNDMPLNPLDPKSKPKRNDPVLPEEMVEAERVLSQSTSEQVLSRKIREKVLRDLHSKHFPHTTSTSCPSVKLNKMQMASQLIAMRDTNASTSMQDSSATHAPVDKHPSLEETVHTAVLGKGVLAEVQADMERMTLPGWIGRIPTNLGSASHGSLSADQWRTACTVNLIVTLIRLWGSLDAGDRHKLMLDNFVELVGATKLANMRSMPSERVEAYDLRMRTYLKGIQELYPETSILPYHHLALHLTRHLKDYGPVQAWRCFPFERFNHMLQQANTNNRFGELEMTMFKNFCMAQNLRSLMKKASLHSNLLGTLTTAFVKIFAGDSRGTLLNDLCASDDDVMEGYRDAKKTVTLDKHIENRLYQRLMNEGYIQSIPSTILRRPIAITPNVSARGVKFSAENDSQGNSLVLFGNYPFGSWGAGRITQILIWTTKSTARSPERGIPFFVVNAFKPLDINDVPHDPYRQYAADIVGRLFYNKYTDSDTPTLLMLKDIVCHFAATKYLSTAIKDECLHVLPLDRE